MEITIKPLKTIRLLFWSFQFCLLSFLTVFTACQKNTGSEVNGAPKTLTLQDSLRWDEIKRRYEHIPADLTKKDTFYLFEMHGSWGMLYHYCAIFHDSVGYVVLSESSIGCDFGCTNCASLQIKKRLAPEEWLSFDHKFKRSDFWNKVETYPGGCIDGNYYQLFIKQGQTLKVAKWSDCNKVSESTRILATQIMACGGLPEYKPVGFYTDKKDSTIIRIRQTSDTFFVKSRTIDVRQLQNGWIPFGENVTVKTIKEYPYPADIFIKEFWIDGTETTRFVTDYKKVSAKEFFWK